jgi:hypothetical protein
MGLIWIQEIYGKNIVNSIKSSPAIQAVFQKVDLCQ